MKSRRNRPDVRSLRSRAGSVRGASVREAQFEQLEQRKLLFSLTITPDMDGDGDGIGQATATFGYTIPYLDSATEVQDADAEDATEDFNDEGPGPIANRTIFDDSDIRVTHGFGFSQNFRIDPPDTEEDERYIQINAVSGSFWMFEPMSVDDDSGTSQVITATTATFTISDPDGFGLLPNGFVVDLMFFDEVIASYTGTELMDQNTSGDAVQRQRGIGTFTFDTSDATREAFTGIRVRALAAEDMRLDDLSFAITPGVFADIVEERIFGAQMSFSGPVGSTVQVLDLYGRDMRLTLALGRPDGIELTLVDLDDDGVPNFNDGIGQIRLSGVDARATVTMFGGTIEFDDEQGFLFTRVDNFVGIYDDFEAAGFGYFALYDDSGQPTTYGLPTGPGSVIFGAPYVRNNANSGTYDAAGAAENGFVTDGFSRADQGVFVAGGESMGSVYIHGVMHGSSRFSGAVNELYFGYMVGTVSVEGDLGTMYVGGDAGMWVVDEDAGEIVDADAFYSTNSQLTVGRTLGELAIGGRSEMHVTVAGDLTDSVARPPRDSFRFIEREKIFQLDPDVQDPEAVIIGDILFPVEGFFDVNTGPLLDFGFGRTPIFNTSTYRNDTLLGAEFVGSISTSVQISGTLGFGDPINGEDGVDMYGFAVSGANPISIQVNSIALVGLVRVLDQNGRPVASTEFPRSVTNLETLTSQTVTFTPPHAGVFYIEVSDVGVGSVDGDNGSGWSYAITLGGLAPVTLGSYRTAGASGVGNVAGFPSVQTLSGSMGVVRVGTAFTGPDGTDQDPSEVMNRPGTDNDDGDETQMDMDQTSFSSAGSLYSLVAGSDIRSGDLFVTGDLGSMYAGMSPVVGGLAGDGLEGDVYGMIMQVGGRVGVIDIKGAIAINQDPDPDTYIFGIGIDLRTGVNGGDGSIGMFRVGSHITGGTLLLNTSPGSTVGAFLVSQDIARSGDEEGIHRGQYFSSDFILGAGSDIRFADFPQIDVASSNDHGFSLFVGQAVEFVDDGGGIVRIEVQGPVEGAFAGVVRVLPVDNGEGVVIARIDGNDGGGLDLSGGRSLRITGIGRADGENSDTPISIGRIMVTGADAASQIVIDGEVEVDVWRIESQVALDRIENTTPGGDIVAADVGGLNTLNIEDGDLGRTQMPAFGPDQIGPFLGIALGEQTAVGGALGIPAEVIVNSADLQGTFRPAGVIDGLYLDDVGSPLSPYLNGLVVRGGDVQSVTSGRGIGDVILQGGGDLLLVAADADLLAGGSALEGIFGHIYAQNIDQVDVGEGLAGGGRAPFASAGIFASDEIRRVDADALNHPGAFISGIIAAGNLTAEPGPDGLPEVGGVGTINVSEGVIDGAYIGAMNLDSFLFSYADGDGSAYLGSIGTIGGRNLVIFRSEIEADTIDHLDLDEGVFDGSTITVRNDIEDLDITRARNSTLTGGPHEFHFNTIIVGRNIGTFTGGDIRDLRIEVVGGVTGLVTADTWRRVELTVSGRVPSIAISGSMVSSTLSLGRLDLLTANAIRTSRIGVSGELGSVTALNEIVNTEFTVSGPTGEIGEITAANRVTGSIVASGPIGSVSSTAGDVIVSVTTTTNRGTVGELVAARDLILDTDISKGVGLLQAGRHLGRPEYSGMIFVQGHLAEVSAGGHIFTDVRVGGRLASATIGPVANRPDAPMGLSGSLYAAEGIGAVAITGDYGGNVVAYTGGIASLTITNGSLLPTGSVRAYDGNVESVVINGGNLYGDIYSDRDIVGVTVLASADGVFGDIGVNHSLSSGSGYDSLRGQLPPGIAPTTGTDGPVIRAGWNITSIVVSGGGMFETTIHAGRALGTVSVAGSILTDGTPGNAGVSTLAAGGSIANISVGGNMDRALVLAGVRSLGDDLAPGGFGDDADTTNSGNIGVIAVSGNMTNTTVAAGMNPGADRVYNSADDRLEIGFSSVNTIQVGGVGTGSSVFTDTLLPGATAGGKIASGGFRRPVAHDDIAAAPAGTPLPNGSAFSFSTGAGTGTITFTGPGSAFFDAANGRVILHRTNLGSGIVVRATGSGVLTGFDIVSTEGASMGLVQVQGVLAGDSDVVIDEAVTRFAFGRIAGEGTIQAGGNIETFTSGEFSGGELVAVHAGSTTVSGRFGDADEDVRGEATMSFVSAGAITVTGGMRGTISAQRFISTLAVGGAIDNGLVHSGSSIGSISAAALRESRISARDSLDSLSIAGDMYDSSVMAGGDLGDDGEIGGEGFDADRVGAGSIGAVTIGGDLEISDIVAGFLRGPDGFFGTSDDLLASGRSVIGSVTIGGDALGSNRGTESYRIASTGSLGPVTAGGEDATNDRNLVIEVRRPDPLPIQVDDVDTKPEGRVFTTTITFNQPIDFSSIAQALSVSEVRGTGDVEIRLIQGVDYVVEYVASTNSIVITFDRAVSERNLPQVSDEPGPGVFRFTIEADHIRAQGVLAELDGDGDGQVRQDEHFSADDIVGDAGDKFSPVAFEVPGQNGFPDTQVDMYGPVSLDIVLDGNGRPDGLPDTNTEFTLNGSIGDHPDHNPNYFSFSSDADIYQITLQAGQILRLGAMQGPGQFAGRFLVQPDGQILGDSTSYGIALPVEPVTTENRDFTFGEDFLIRQTGTFFIVVSNTGAIFNQGTLPNLDPAPGAVGAYSFTVEVFDDGDSGFSAPTDSGNGQDLVNAPPPSAFAGQDGVLGTSDDPGSIVNGAYVFRFDAGPDATPGTADDFVSGSNGSNVTSITNALGVRINSVNAAMGPEGAAGLPTGFTPDVDVFHLNGGNPIANGAVVRVTLKLSELGSDLGSRLGNLDNPIALDNYVRFAIFDTTTSEGTDDALLLYAPSDAAPTSGDAGVIAESNNVEYGYDQNGDFFIEFVAPGRQDFPGQPGSYAVYVQGLINSDYRLEVVTSGSRELVHRTQNIVLEVNGGSVDWLEVGGVTTPIGPFVASALGFTGRAPNGQVIDDYIVERVTDTLQDVFDSIVVGAGSDGVLGTPDDERGLDINISSNPADFEFQEFSTIFLTSSLDPVDAIFPVDALIAFGFTGLTSTQPFGVSEHVDPGNADREDEAILFVPSFSILGYSPTPDELDAFAQSLAAAAGRRIGELLGLNITEAYDPTQDVFDIMAVNSVVDAPGDVGDYEYLNQARRLSTPNDLSTDSDFFLGYQNAAQLLRLYTRDG